MAQAIVYCDRCGRMVPPSEIGGNKVIVAGNVGLCPQCVASLGPAEREEFKRRLSGEPDPVHQTSRSKTAAPRKPRASKRTDGGTARRSRQPRSRTGLVVAGLAAGGLVGIAIAVVMATGPSDTPRTVRRRRPVTARVRRAGPADRGDVAPSGGDAERLRAEALRRAEEKRRLAELKEIAAVRRRLREAVRVNLALGKPATASAVERNRVAGLAVDGDLNTRWCAVDGRTGHWWRVDLGEARELVGCRITWENDAGTYHYKIDGSQDGKSWSTLVDRTSDKAPPGSTVRGKVSTHTFDAGAVRYLRVVVTGLKHRKWASIFEFEAQGREAAARPGRKVGVHYFSEHAEKINRKCSWDAGSDSRCYAWKPQGSQRESAILRADTKDFVEGRSSMCFVINSAQSRWVLEMNPKVGTGAVDLSKFTRMGLSLKSEAAKDWTDFRIIIESKDGGSYSVPVSKTGFKPDGKWHACAVDLGDVAAAGVDLARVNKIIQFAWGGGVEDGDTFKLDDLHFAE